MRFHFTKGLFKKYPNRWYAYDNTVNLHNVHDQTSYAEDTFWTPYFDELIEIVQDMHYTPIIEYYWNFDNSDFDGPVYLCRTLSIEFNDYEEEVLFIVRCNDGIEVEI